MAIYYLSHGMHTYGQQHINKFIFLIIQELIYGENFEGFEHTLEIICLQKYFQIFYFHADENFLRGAHCKIQKFKNKGHPNVNM